MPVEKVITEKYWTGCEKWGVPYPCRKTRTVTKWCYSFSIWRENKFLSFTHNTACENNIEYSWKRWNAWKEFGFGSFLHINVEKCFSSQLKGKDGCSLDGEGVAINRID